MCLYALVLNDVRLYRVTVCTEYAKDDLFTRKVSIPKRPSIVAVHLLLVGSLKSYWIAQELCALCRVVLMIYDNNPAKARQRNPLVYFAIVCEM